MDSSTKNNTAFAVPAWSRIATTDLPVYQRAVTPLGSRGQICPITGGAGRRTSMFRGIDLAAHTARFGLVAGAVRSTTNVELSKPRTGYLVISGTG